MQVILFRIASDHPHRRPRLSLYCHSVGKYIAVLSPSCWKALTSVIVSDLIDSCWYSFSLELSEKPLVISYTRELRSLGIAVIFEEQNINSIYPESEFLIALHAAFAQSESESISANVRWGKRQSIKDGKVTFQYKTMLG